MQIKDALRQLDVADNSHWADDGRPDPAAVSAILGRDVTSDEIRAAGPRYTREAVLQRLGNRAVSKPAPKPEPVEPATYDHLPLLEQPVALIMADPVKCAAALAEIQVESQRLLAEKAKIEKRLRGLFDLSNGLTLLLERHYAASRNGDKLQADVAEYLKVQNAAREQRAARTQAFIEAGTSAELVAAALRGKAPIDAAMAGRKAPRGSQRPSMVTKPIGE